MSTTSATFAMRSWPYSRHVSPSWPLALLFAVTIAGYPFVSVFPVILGMDSRVFSVPYRVFVAIACCGIFLQWLVQRRVIYVGQVLVIVTLLWTLLLSRLIWDTWISPMAGQMFMSPGRFIGLSVGATFLPAIAFLQIPDHTTLRRARGLIEIIGGAALVCAGVLGAEVYKVEAIADRLSTETLNPISVGHLGLSVLIVSLMGIAASRSGRSSYVGLLALLARLVLVIIATIATAASLSKGPIMCAAICVLLVAWAWRAESEGTAVLRIGAMIVLLVLSGLAAFQLILNLDADSANFAASRFVNIAADYSTQLRIQLLTGALQQFTAHPLLGSAVVERVHMTYPHNLFVETMMMIGVAGLLLMTLVLIAAVHAASRVLRSGPNLAWVAILMVQYLVALMFSGSVLIAPAFWGFLIAVLAIDASLRYSRGPLAA